MVPICMHVEFNEELDSRTRLEFILVKKKIKFSNPQTLKFPNFNLVDFCY